MIALDEYMKRLSSNDEKFAIKLRRSLEFVLLCLNRYGLENVSLAFNGGKDCTVLLHMLLYAAGKCTAHCRSLSVFYAKPKRTFIEVENFVAECEKRYGLLVARYDDPLKLALAKFQRDHPQRRYIFMGSRSTDPGHNGAVRIAPTDPDWPNLILLKPMLDWSYKDVWRFLLDLNIAYCPLYDLGYTSLGSSDSSVPNPALLVKKGVDGHPAYKPAYLLDDISKERRSRQQ